MIRALLLFATVAYALPVQAGQVTGQGKAIDSTIIEVNNQRVILFGVDSVMRKQTCLMDSKPWPCWTAAVRDLQALLDRGSVTCDMVGDPDVYGRDLGRCTVDGQSVNEQLVSHGFALARRNESSDYVNAEASAKAKKIGLWQGQFVQPAEFRRTLGILVEDP